MKRLTLVMMLFAAAPTLAGDVILVPLDAPPVPFYSTDEKNCAWKTGGGIGLWAEDCKFDTGHWQVNYDPAITGFSLSIDHGQAFPVLRQFTKRAEEGADGDSTRPHSQGTGARHGL